MNLLDALKQSEKISDETSAATPETQRFPALDFPESPQKMPDIAHESISRMKNAAERQRPAEEEKMAPLPATAPSNATRAEQQSPLLSAPRNKLPPSLWLAIGGGILLISIGVWFWWQLQQLNIPATPLPVVRMASVAASSITEEEEETPVQALAPSTLTPTAAIPLEPAPSAHRPKANKVTDIEAQPKPLPGIKQTQVETAVFAPLEAAWQAWQRGDFSSAETLYHRAQANDPRNRDAQLGLAALAAHRGQTAQAVRWYQRLLALNPQDEDARTGLLLLQPEALSESGEAQLLQTTAPDHAPQILGQHYAARKRWHEAQEQYFRAFVRDPDNADLAYNLAVSLDHINQKKLAADYYRRALALAPGNFKPSAAKQRLTELMAELP